MQATITVTTQEVARLLETADGTNPDQDGRKNATSRLQSVSQSSGYMAALVEVWSKSPNDSLRHVAIIQFKNNSRWFYSKPAKEAIKTIDTERTHCRDVLIQGFLKESNFLIANQVALALAKVARGEWMKKNVSIVNKCCEMLEDPQYIFKGCLLCDEIFRELGSLQIASHKQGYPDVASKVTALLFPIWQRACQKSLEQLQAFSSGGCSKEELLNSLTLLGLSNASLQKIITSNPNLSGASGNVIENMIDLLRIFGLQIYNQIPDDNLTLEPVKSKINQILTDAKTCILEAQKKFPYEFRRFLARYLTFTREIIDDGTNPRLLLTFAFSFLKNVYNCRAYDASKRGGGSNVHKKKGKDIVCPIWYSRLTNQLQMHIRTLIGDARSSSKKLENILIDELGTDRIDIQNLLLWWFSSAKRASSQQKTSHNHKTYNRGGRNKKKRSNHHHGLPLGVIFDGNACQEAHNICQQFYTDENIIQICEIIVVRFLILTEYDMKKWNTDPEDFFQESTIESSNEAVRQVCANFFKQLVKKKSKLIGPHIVNLFIQTLQKDTSDPQCAIEREALYHAVGLGYFQLHDALKAVDFTFDKFYQQFLQPDCNPVEKHPCLVRRAVWLLGEVKDDLLRNRQITVHVFETLVTVMTQHQDIVIRLTCVQSLKKLILDAAFEPSTFLPQSSNICEALVGILNNLETVTNVGFVITCLTNILDKMGSEMGSRAGGILQLVQQLWGNFPHDLVRASVVGVLTSVVKALKDASTEYHEFLLPVLEYVTDFTQSDRLYLTERGLELWLAVAQNSSRMTPQLLSLFERCVYCMMTIPDMLQYCINLFKSYLLLGGAQFVSEYQTQLKEVLAQTIQTLDSSGICALTNVLCMFIQMFPEESPMFLQPVIEKLMINFVELTHPFKLQTMKPYLMICGRLFFHNFQTTIQLIMSLEQRESRSILDDVLKRYVNYVEKLKLTYDQKLCTLALCNFAFVDLDHIMLARMVPILMKCAIETASSDIKYSSKHISGTTKYQMQKISSTPKKNLNSIDSIPGGPKIESHRLLALVASDPCASADVVQCVRNALDNILSKMGTHKFQKQLKKIPNKTLTRWEHVQKKNRSNHRSN